MFRRVCDFLNFFDVLYRMLNKKLIEYLNG